MEKRKRVTFQLNIPLLDRIQQHCAKQTFNSVDCEIALNRQERDQRGSKARTAPAGVPPWQATGAQCQNRQVVCDGAATRSAFGQALVGLGSSRPAATWLKSPLAYDLFRFLRRTLYTGHPFRDGATHPRARTFILVCVGT